MKCWIHPEQDAVAVCKSCGKGVCKDCVVDVRGDSYCKTCIESGRVVAVEPSEPTVAEEMPTPTGTPSKAFLVVGGVGCIISSIAAIWFFFNILMPTAVGYPLSDIIGHTLLFIGLILASFGYLGMRRNYGSGVGTAGFAVGIVVSVLFILWTIVLSMGYISDYFYYYDWYYDFGAYLGITIYDIFFAMMILWAVAHITTRRFTGKSGLSIATGIMLIITALLLEVTNILWALMFAWEYDVGLAFYDMSNALYATWVLLFFISEIVATISFFTANVPESPKPSS
jgi:hypothetical protein